MKNITLAFAFFFLIIKGVMSQVIITDNKTDFRSKFIIGFKVGGNKSNVFAVSGPSFVTTPKYGLAFGAFAVIPIGRTFAIQPEVLYSQKGFKADSKVLNTSYSFTRTSNYLDVPILFTVNLSEFISLHAGPQYSYLMKQIDEYGTSTSSIIATTDFTNNNIRKNVFCFLTGFSINIKHVVLGARAGWDIQNNDGNGTSTNPKYKNVWYQASVGYRFYTNF